MAWYNPFSWSGGPDEVDWGPLRQIAGQIQQGGQDIRSDIQNIDFGVTQADQQLWDKSYGHMRDLIMQDLLNVLPGIVGQASGQAGARGLAGSGIEASLRTGAATTAQRESGRVLAGFGANQAGQMAGFAAQRGAQELTRNQALWQNLLQSYQPAMNIESAFLESEQERIAKEKGAFGNLLGKAAGVGAFFINPALGTALLGGTYGSQQQQQQQGRGGGGMSPADTAAFNSMRSFPLY